MFLGRRLSPPSPTPWKSPVCDPRMPMGGSYTLSAPPSARMRLCFMSLRALLWRRTKREWETVNRLGRAVLCSAVRYQRQEKLCLGQPNLNQALVGNSQALPGGGTRLPPPPLLHILLWKPQITLSRRPQLPQPFDAQIHIHSLHPPPSCPLRMQQWTVLS